MRLILDPAARLSAQAALPEGSPYGESVLSHLEKIQHPVEVQADIRIDALRLSTKVGAEMIRQPKSRQSKYVPTAFIRGRRKT